MCDIDHFKEFNDRYGHLAGDVLLKSIAECLVNTLRDSDIVARYGGEEFAVILPETSIDDALIVAERLRKNVDLLKADYESDTLSVSMSFGIAKLDAANNLYAADLLKRADHALYQAKEAGRNRCCLFDKTVLQETGMSVCAQHH